MSLIKCAILIAWVSPLHAVLKNPQIKKGFYLPNELKKWPALYLIHPMFHLAYIMKVSVFNKLNNIERIDKLISFKISFWVSGDVKFWFFLFSHSKNTISSSARHLKSCWKLESWSFPCPRGDNPGHTR